MNMTQVTVNTPAHTGLLGRLSYAVAVSKARYARYKIFRDTLAEMQELTDRELADLGLSRSMIRREAYEAAYG